MPTIQEGKGMSREMLLITVQLKCTSSVYIKQPSVFMDLLLGQGTMTKMSHLSI